MNHPVYRCCEDVSMLYKKSVLADGLVFASPFLFLSRRACKMTMITTRHYHYRYCAQDDTKRSHTSLKVIYYVVCVHVYNQYCFSKILKLIIIHKQYGFLLSQTQFDCLPNDIDLNNILMIL